MDISSIASASLALRTTGVSGVPGVDKIAAQEALPAQLAINATAPGASLVDLSVIGQFLSAAAAFRARQVAGAAVRTSATQSTTTDGTAQAGQYIDAAQQFFDAFNSLQALEIDSAQSLLGVAIDSPLQAVLDAPSGSGNGKTLAASLAGVGITFLPASWSGGAAQFTVDLTALQAALAADPAGTSTLLAHAFQALSQIAKSLIDENAGLFAADAGLTQVGSLSVSPFDAGSSSSADVALNSIAAANVDAELQRLLAGQVVADAAPAAPPAKSAIPGVATAQVAPSPGALPDKLALAPAVAGASDNVVEGIQTRQVLTPPATPSVKQAPQTDNVSLPAPLPAEPAANADLVAATGAPAAGTPAPGIPVSGTPAPAVPAPAVPAPAVPAPAVPAAGAPAAGAPADGVQAQSRVAITTAGPVPTQILSTSTSPVPLSMAVEQNIASVLLSPTLNSPAGSAIPGNTGVAQAATLFNQIADHPATQHELAEAGAMAALLSSAPAGQFAGSALASAIPAAAHLDTFVIDSVLPRLLAEQALSHVPAAVLRDTLPVVATVAADGAVTASGEAAPVNVGAASAPSTGRASADQAIAVTPQAQADAVQDLRLPEQATSASPATPASALRAAADPSESASGVPAAAANNTPAGADIAAVAAAVMAYRVNDIVAGNGVHTEPENPAQKIGDIVAVTRVQPITLEPHDRAAASREQFARQVAGQKKTDKS